MKLLWLTDIHLNFLDKENRFCFYDEMIKSKSDKMLITGDIAEAPSVIPILKDMDDDQHSRIVNRS